MKPGIKTTEFWSTVLFHVITVVSLVLTATGSAFDTSKLNALVPVAALIASGAAQAFYSLSRAKVKAAPVAVAEVPAPAPVADGNLVPPFNG